jgi:hypothetical protein
MTRKDERKMLESLWRKQKRRKDVSRRLLTGLELANCVDQI